MTEPSQPVYRASRLAIGVFRCRPGHPRFRDSGPARGNLLVFPREPVEIRHAGRAPVIADATTAMIYNEHQAYTRTAVVPAGDRCEWFAFAAEDVLAARAAYAPSDDLARPFGELVRVPVDAHTYLLARRAFTIARGPVPDETWLEETCAALLDRVLRTAHDAPPPSPSAAHRVLAEEARALVARRFAEPLSLAQIAAALDVSPFHLARTFRAVTGTTVHAFRNQLRLRAALERIADGCSLAAIAADLGFASHSHFTQAFRGAFASPPRAVRARI